VGVTDANAVDSAEKSGAMNNEHIAAAAKTIAQDRLLIATSNLTLRLFFSIAFCQNSDATTKR
jgi:hypothetical protein